MDIRYLLKELFAEPTRVLLTILAIAWGTAAITIMLAMGEGLRETLGATTSSLSKAVIDVSGGSTSIANAGKTNNQPIALTRQDLNSLKTVLADVADVSAEYYHQTRISYKDKAIRNRVLGVDSLYLNMADLTFYPGSRTFNPEDFQRKRQVVIIDEITVERLFPKNINPIGKQMFIEKQPFTIIGVIKQQLSNSAFFLRRVTLMPDSTFYLLSQEQYFARFIIAPYNPDYIPNIEQQVRRVIAFNHNVSADDPNIIRFQNNYEEQSTVNRFFSSMQIFLAVIGSITLLVAGAGIANVMFVSVNSATREIGIRMAVGALPKQILRHYILEALMATAIGGAIGIAFSQLMFFIYNIIPMNNNSFAAQAIGKPEPVISISILVTIIIILGIIGTLAGFFPARRAANINPVDALRQE